MAKISKKERTRIIQIIIGVIATALLWTPLDNLVTNSVGTGGTRLIIGIGFLILLAFIGKLNI